MTLLLMVLLAAACNPGAAVNDSRVGYTHDAAHHVSCWTNGTTGGISCLPDSEVVNP